MSISKYQNTFYIYIVWNKILSVLVLAIGYFPLFAALAFDTIVGFSTATLYAWALFIVQVYKMAECDRELVGNRLDIFFLENFVSSIHIHVMLCTKY